MTKPTAAIVTGAGRGIGAAVAEALAREGVRVLAVARSERELAATCESIAAEGGTARPFPADVTEDGAPEAIVAACEAQLGSVDALVNCAGVQGAIGPFADVDPGEWWRVVEINLRGSVAMCAAVLPGMIARGRGSIINFSGGGAATPRPRFSAYAASKAALVRFTETLAVEVAGQGIAVNAIAPGAVDTRMQDAVLEAGARAGLEYEQTRALRSTGEGSVPATLAASLTVHLVMGRAPGLTGKLISAPHDDWRDWDAERLLRLAANPWLTLRRLDPHTLEPLLASGGSIAP